MVAWRSPWTSCAQRLPRLAPKPFFPAWLPRARQSSTVAQSSIAAILQSSSADDPPSNGNTVIIHGFVRSVRRQKRVAFAAIGDGSSVEPLQAILTPEQAEGLSTGTGVRIKGEWRPSPAGKQQTHELHASQVTTLGQNDASTYPLQKKYHTPEFLRTLPHLRSRLSYNSLLLRLRSEIIAHVTSFFVTRDFVQSHPPIITSSDCEGAGEVFTVSAGSSPAPTSSEVGDVGHVAQHFFRSPKYLTVSSQLHLEALAQSVGKVWTLSPTFRAEKSDTPRHLSEFYMLEAEVCFLEDLNQIMNIVEDMLRNLANKLQTSRVGKELLQARPPVAEHQDEEASITREALSERWQGLIRGPWPRITYSDAIAKLQEAASRKNDLFEFDPSFESGLQAEHERFLAEQIGKGSPIFVTDYPRALKPFYMAPRTAHAGGVDEAGPTVACFDLLVPELCELVGGSMREHRLPELLEQMETHGMLKLTKPSPESQVSGAMTSALTEVSGDHDPAQGSAGLQWYLDLRRFGSVPHGGFGLGFDRLLSYLSGVSNIRDVVSFPRWYGRCDC